VSGERRQVGRIWKTTLLLACLTAAAITLLASPALAKKGATAKKGSVAGRLDPSFGKGGKATVAFPAEDAGDVGVKYNLPFQFAPGHLVMAPGPGGTIVVAGSTKIVEFLPNGKLNRGFGTGGSVTIERPSGMTFVLADVAVDSQGRVLIAGSARPQPAESTPDPLISSAAVMRFGADGSIDRGFGREGTLITDFGMQPPAIGGGRYKGAAVGLRSLVVDSQDRPLLTGGSVAKVADCYTPESAVSTAFVARLTTSGGLDPSFGGGGLRQIENLSTFEQGSLVPSGALFTVGLGRPRCGTEGGGPAVVLTSIDANGNLDPNFGFAGFRSVAYPRTPVVTVAPSGKIVLLGQKKGKTQLVTRLLPDGALDPSFGRTGRIEIVLPKGGATAAVAVDRRGRLLFAGRVSRRVSKSEKNPVTRSSFLLGRMGTKGSFDRSFGRRGSVRTGFGGPSSSFATSVMLDGKDRILVGGQLSNPRFATGGGFAIARYLGGR